MPDQPSSLSVVTTHQLGVLLRAQRRSLKLTQADVGGRVAISQKHVSHLELHPDQISAKQLLNWCAAIGLDLQLVPRESPAERQEW